MKNENPAAHQHLNEYEHDELVEQMVTYLDSQDKSMEPIVDRPRENPIAFVSNPNFQDRTRVKQLNSLDEVKNVIIQKKPVGITFLLTENQDLVFRGHTFKYEGVNLELPEKQMHEDAPTVRRSVVALAAVCKSKVVASHSGAGASGTGADTLIGTDSSQDQGVQNAELRLYNLRFKAYFGFKFGLGGMSGMSAEVLQQLYADGQITFWVLEPKRQQAPSALSGGNSSTTNVLVNLNPAAANATSAAVGSSSSSSGLGLNPNTQTQGNLHMGNDSQVANTVTNAITNQPFGGNFNQNFGFSGQHAGNPLAMSSTALPFQNNNSMFGGNDIFQGLQQLQNPGGDDDVDL